jgi:hypothetical protein
MRGIAGVLVAFGLKGKIWRNRKSYRGRDITISLMQEFARGGKGGAVVAIGDESNGKSRRERLCPVHPRQYVRLGACETAGGPIRATSARVGAYLVR